MKPLFWRMMLISVLSWVGSIAATPVLMRDTFEAGEPISEKEFSNAISSKAAGKFHNLPLFLFVQVANRLATFMKGWDRMNLFRGTYSILSSLKVTSCQRERKAPSSTPTGFGQMQRFPTLFLRISVRSLFF
jgi:hypothetical protein